MSFILKSFFEVFSLLRKDKTLILLGCFPTLIGTILYLVGGSYYYNYFTGWGKAYIEQSVSQGTFGSIVYYLLVAILTVLLFFIVNWTFVLIVTILASPFNDAISARIEKHLGGEALESISLTFKNIFKLGLGVIFNESKKVSLIIFLSILAAIFGLIPILGFVSVILSALLISVEFLDYNWGRHRLTFKKCKNDLFKNGHIYGTAGLFFMFLLSIPFLNLVVLPFAVMYYSTLWFHVRKV